MSTKKPKKKVICALSFFSTVRRQKPAVVDDSDVQRIRQYLEKTSLWWFIVREKSGVDSHLHIVDFLKRPQQRCNYIFQFQKHCLASWTDAERHNHKYWNHTTNQAAVKSTTSLELITDYLSGTRKEKSDDPFEIIDKHLPDDLSELETFLPDVGALKRPKNGRFHDIFYDMQIHCQLSSQRPPPIRYHLTYITGMFDYLVQHDHREAMYEPHKSRFLVQFTEWLNMRSCGHEVEGTSPWLWDAKHLALA